jgi:RimJ/RimL family protein N-acetyltransferase
VRLRPVTLDDLPFYERLRCDPVVMAELGGPVPRESLPAKVRNDVAMNEAGQARSMIVVTDDGVDAGHAGLWEHDHAGERITEIGWMVLPELQGRGLGGSAARALLDLARDEGRWFVVHAFTGTNNVPSNALCRSLGMQQRGTDEIDFSGRTLLCNHWVIDLRDAARP